MNANFGNYRPIDYAHHSTAGRDIGNALGDAFANVPIAVRAGQEWQQEIDERNVRKMEVGDAHAFFRNTFGPAGFTNVPDPRKGESLDDYVARVSKAADTFYQGLSERDKGIYYQKAQKAVDQYKGLTHSQGHLDRFNVGAMQSKPLGEAPKQGGEYGQTPLAVQAIDERNDLPGFGAQLGEGLFPQGAQGPSLQVGSNTPISIPPMPQPQATSPMSLGPMSAPQTPPSMDGLALNTPQLPTGTGTPVPTYGNHGSGGIISQMAEHAEQQLSAPQSPQATPQSFSEQLNEADQRFVVEAANELRRRHAEIVEMHQRRLISPTEALAEERKIRAEYAALMKGKTAREIQLLEQQMAQEREDNVARRTHVWGQQNQNEFIDRRTGKAMTHINPADWEHVDFGENFGERQRRHGRNMDHANLEIKREALAQKGTGGSGSDELLSQEIQRYQSTRGDLRAKLSDKTLRIPDDVRENMMRQYEAEGRHLDVLADAREFVARHRVSPDEGRRAAQLMHRNELSLFLPALRQSEGLQQTLIGIARDRNVTAKEIRDGLIKHLARNERNGYADDILGLNVAEQTKWINTLLEKNGYDWVPDEPVGNRGRRR
ncbi:MAG: hypothetical protein LBU70_05005 [Chitinispirillales bacterium]|jgi:hypothetical protein|nr:hypothetical protein [Chitinispirillales bacterium]